MQQASQSKITWILLPHPYVTNNNVLDGWVREKNKNNPTYSIVISFIDNENSSGVLSERCDVMFRVYWCQDVKSEICSGIYNKKTLIGEYKTLAAAATAANQHLFNNYEKAFEENEGELT